MALDVGVDTTTPAGEMVANVMATFAQFERRLIGQRTKDALAIKRANGVRLGRPPVIPAELRVRLADARAAGATYQQIAESLNAERVAIGHGGRKWYPATVLKAIRASVA